jgi:alpha-methylacyl-CoA racemase
MLGRPGQPPTIPHNLLADYAGGGFHGAIGVLAALMARTQTGRGQYVDISMMDGTLALLAPAFSTFFATNQVPRRGENPTDGGIPNYNVYLTKDDKYITIGSMEPWFFANLCRTL